VILIRVLTRPVEETEGESEVVARQMAIEVMFAARDRIGLVQIVALRGRRG
jgi:hypothetical protein